MFEKRKIEMFEKRKIDEETKKRHLRIKNAILAHRRLEIMTLNSKLNNDNWGMKNELDSLRDEVDHISEMLYAILEELGCIKGFI